MEEREREGRRTGRKRGKERGGNEETRVGRGDRGMRQVGDEEGAEKKAGLKREKRKR